MSSINWSVGFRKLNPPNRPWLHHRPSVEIVGIQVRDGRAGLTCILILQVVIVGDCPSVGCHADTTPLPMLDEVVDVDVTDLIQ